MASSQVHTTNGNAIDSSSGPHPSSPTMWKTRGLLLLATALTIAIETAPSAAVLCTRKSGILAVRDSCRKSEHQVDPEAIGLVGPQGLADPAGPPGPPSDTLATNQTVRGVFSIAQDSAPYTDLLAPISFGLRVFGPGENGGPRPVYVALGEQRAECPGHSFAPEAAPGYLCVYEAYRANVDFVAICEPHRFTINFPESCNVDPHGALVVAIPSSAGKVWLAGAWAATAIRPAA